MGAIKDIVDLCIKLRNENRDGKVAAAISEIQSLTLAPQSDQAAIVEKNTELMTENLDLKRKLLDMENTHTQAIAALQEKHRTDEDSKNSG
jgi:copper oxidase (laccase) domain-containing protein